MSRRRLHYERAFEGFLRARGIPYVTVDEARKALLGAGAIDGLESRALKSFDFVVYGAGRNHLIDVKGRKMGAAGRGRLESWVTTEDVESLAIWQGLFGDGFGAGFVFMHWCEQQPPDALFQEVIEHRGRWYALRHVALDDYRDAMRVRSQRWGTVDLPAQDYHRLSEPFCPIQATRPRTEAPATV